MRIFVGLGNPGGKYAGNRHNIGFMAVDRIAADHGFPPWKARWNGLVSEGRLGDARVVLLKPQQFMNLSGQSVGEAIRYLKLTPADMVVFHDELDLAPGKLRLKQGGGHAGHNGLRSLHQHIGPDYQRVRLGIGHPGHKDRVVGHVLADFAKADADWLEDLLAAISDAAPLLAAGDDGRFQNRVAERMQPVRQAKPAAKAAPAKPSAPPETAPASAPETAPEVAPRPAPQGMAERLAALTRRFRP